MSRLVHWDSGGKEEIRKVPIVCSICGEQVSVGGWVHEGRLVFENCPSCDAPIRGEMSAGIEEKEEGEKSYPISAEIVWRVEGGVESERTAKYGPVIPVIDLLFCVVQSGVDYFSHSALPGEEIYETFCLALVQKVLPLKQVQAVVDECNKRIAEAVQAAPFQVISRESGGNGQAIKSKQDKDKETEDDDE